MDFWKRRIKEEVDWCSSFIKNINLKGFEWDQTQELEMLVNRACLILSERENEHRQCLLFSDLNAILGLRGRLVRFKAPATFDQFKTQLSGFSSCLETRDREMFQEGFFAANS